MKKYKHIFIGLFICSFYFINSTIINFSIGIYIRHLLNSYSNQQVIDYIAKISESKYPKLDYYALMFKVMFWVYLGLIIVLCIVYRKHIRNKLKTTFDQFKPFCIQLVKYIAMLLILSVIVFFANATLFPEFKSTIGQNQSIINQVVLYKPNIYVFIVVLLFAPIVEEYIFRYGLINRLLKNCRPAVQIILSALIFSLIHLNFEQLALSPIYFLHLLLLYLPMAVVYGYVYIREKNILFPLTIHILNNIGSIVLVLITTNLYF